MSEMNSSNTFIARGSNQSRRIQNAINSLNLSQKNELENILLKLYNDHKITENKRLEFLVTFEEISNHIKQCFPNVVVCLYGSHASGLANKDSDLDITILFRNGNEFSYLDMCDLKEKLGIIFDYLYRKYLNVTFIATAKIPIVKFKTRNGINVDISINNFHALQNTHLLKTYSDLDSRVIVLGQLLKQFIKFYTTGDAYSDMLTSYGHMLMLIHYLQVKNVLCVLREDIDYDVDPDFLKCDKMYPYMKLNKASRNCRNLGIVDLWIGFFKYYTMEFKIKKHAISITDLEIVSKIRKFWNLYLSIKDPIDPFRDVAIHLKSKSVEKILRSFSNVLLHKGNIKQIISGFSKNTISEEHSKFNESEQSESDDESSDSTESEQSESDNESSDSTESEQSESDGESSDSTEKIMKFKGRNKYSNSGVKRTSRRFV